MRIHGVDERSPIHDSGYLLHPLPFDDWFCPSTLSRLFGVGVLVLWCYVGTTYQNDSLHSSLTRIVIMNVCSGALASSSTPLWHRSQWQGPSGRWIEMAETAGHSENCVVWRIWLFHRFILPFLNPFDILKSVPLAESNMKLAWNTMETPDLAKITWQLSARIIWIPANRQHRWCLIYGTWLLVRVHGWSCIISFSPAFGLLIWGPNKVVLTWKIFIGGQNSCFFFRNIFLYFEGRSRWNSQKRVYFFGCKSLILWR